MNNVQTTAAALLLLLAAASHAAPNGNPGQAARGAALAPAAATPAQQHFNRAAEAFAAKAYARAASEIRLGERFVARQADRAAGSAHQALKASASQLATLADSVEHGAVKDASALDRAFAKAQHALEQRPGAGRRG